jgi:GWxTD domain-containing protein
MIVDAVFWILVAWAVRTTVLFAFVGLLLWIFRAKDVSLRLSVWTAALVGALLLPVLSLTTRQILIPVPLLMRAPADAGTVEQSSGFAGSVGEVRMQDTSSRRRSWTWPEIFVIVWAAGISLAMLRVFIGLYFSRRLVRASREIDFGTRESSAVTVPIVVGLLRPVILLPCDWRGWDPEKLEAVMAHERAHVRRRDPLRRLVGFVYCGLCWFHPLAWWLSAHLAELAEAASDDAALLAIGNDTLYAEMLVRFWQQTPRRVLWEGIGMARGGKLTRRMQRILDSDRPLSRDVTRGAWVVLLSAAVPIIYFAASALPVWAAPETRPPAPRGMDAGQPSPPASALTGKRALSPRLMADFAAQAAAERVYYKWLNEDVAYIVTEAERAEFKRLWSDRQRQVFIEQFWLRRDPTPGTVENEFKEEHYRRIAYANERFATRRAGWKTDRGRMYIIFGPPTENESHPSVGADGEPPHEIWRYRHIDGVGDNVSWLFVDVGATGEYELTDPKAEPASEPNSAGGPPVALLPFIISVPLEGGNERVIVFARIWRVDQETEKARMGFETFAEGLEYRRKIHLPAGSYRLDAVVKRQDGTSYRNESYFDVK